MTKHNDLLSPLSGQGLIVLWLPWVVWMVVIFLGSAVPGSELPGVLGLPYIDKILHFFEFAVFGLLAARVVKRWPVRSPDTVMLIAAVAVIAFFYGLIDETHQIFVPNREFDLSDLSADIIGGALGAWTWLLTSRHPRAPGWW